MDWRTREIFTRITFGGKTLREIGWPGEWEYNIVLRGWEKDGGTSERFASGGERVEEPYLHFLSDRALYEMQA